MPTEAHRIVCCETVTESHVVGESVHIPHPGAALWAELHTATNPTPEWFAEWVQRVKGLVCNCGGKLDGLLAENPPRYDDWFCWSVELHNAVNLSLGRKEWTVEEAARVHKSLPVRHLL